MYLNNRIGDLQGKPVLYVNGEPYSAALISPIMQPSGSGESARLELVLLSLDQGYGILTWYTSPGTYTPNPTSPGTDVPPDLIRVPDNPEKGNPVPLRMPWNPDTVPKGKNDPKKKKRDPFGIVH